MFEQIVNLITRGVVALEIIAKHYETVGAAVGKQEDKKPSKAKKEVVEDDDAEDEAPAKTKKVGILKRARTRVIILPSHCLLLVSAVAFCFGAFFFEISC